MQCDNGQTITIVTTNAAASGQIVDDTGVLIFRGGTVLITNLTKNTTRTVTFTQGQGNQAGLQDDVIECTATIEFTNPESGDLIRNDAVFYFTVVPRRE